MATITEDGRLRIGVNQQPGGGNYPFVDPSTDVQNLLADAFLSFSDTTCRFKLPFSITWLHGFGVTASSQPPSTPTPTHAYDLVVKDANGLTVFDSTTAAIYQTNDWDNSYRIIEWITASAVMRVVTFLSWGPQDTPVDYPTNIVPSNGVLDPRTLFQMPANVQSIAGGGQQFNSGVVKLVAGYNVRIDVIPPTSQQAGNENVTLVVLNADPGMGLGRFPGCQPAVPEITRINGIEAAPNGDFHIVADGCYRLERPNSITKSTAPRKAVVTENTVQLFNNCTPCCTCDDFVSVYQAIRRLRARYVTLGTRAERARDLFKKNKKRWEDQQQCRSASSLRLSTFPVCPNLLYVGGAFCNMNQDCITNLELRFSFKYHNAGISASTTAVGSLVCGSSFRGGVTTQNKTGTAPGAVREAASREPYALGGAWPEFRAFFPLVSRGGNANVVFAIKFPHAHASDHAQVVIEAYQGDVLLAGPGLRSSGLIVADEHGNCPCDQAASGSSF